MKEIKESFNSNTTKILLMNNCEPFNIEKYNIENIKSSVTNYLLKNFRKKYIFYKSIQEKIKKLRENCNDDLLKQINEFKDKRCNSINEILCCLKWGDKISIEFDSRGRIPKCCISFKDRGIETYSNGERHKLALAIFLDNVKIIIEKETNKKNDDQK